MKNCLVDYKYQLTAPYIANVLVYSKSFEDHITHMQPILQQFRDIYRMDYRMDSSLTKSITRFLVDSPRHVAGVLRLLGLLRYFPRHILSFRTVA